MKFAVKNQWNKRRDLSRREERFKSNDLGFSFISANSRMLLVHSASSAPHSVPDPTLTPPSLRL
jgi:hypothetical protein